MEIINNKIKHSLDLKDYILDKACFMDIETTGLNRQKDLVYLVGILYYEDGFWVLRQYFLNNPINEVQLIKNSMDFMDKFDKIITYNGQSFDLPFLNKKAEKYGLGKLISNEKSFDIYRIVKENKDILRLENLKLKTIEKYLGIKREDIYSGYECIAFYKDYIVNKDNKNKTKVLKHNFDDLVYMLDSIEILDKIKDLKTLNIKADSSNYKFIINKFNFQEDRLIIDGGISPKLDINQVDYNNYYTFKTKDLTSFNLVLEINKAYANKDTLCYFIDLNNYGFKLGKSQLNLRLPPNIYPVKLGNQVLFENIKLFVGKFIKNKFL